MDAPSVVSVALALSHAIMPKDVWLAGFGIDLDWPVAGIPQVLHVDNGKDFDSAALLRGCQEYGIELEFRPPGSPHYGGTNISYGSIPTMLLSLLFTLDHSASKEPTLAESCDDDKLLR